MPIVSYLSVWAGVTASALCLGHWGIVVIFFVRLTTQRWVDDDLTSVLFVLHLKLLQVSRASNAQIRHSENQIIYKVITTMVIRLLDDPTLCAQPVVADLWPLGLGYMGCQGWVHSLARRWVPISFPKTRVVYFLPFLSYLAGSKSISVCPTQIRWQIPL